MEEGRPSITAFVVAVLRAHHFASTPEPRIMDDHLAMPLAGMASAEEASARFDEIVGRLAEHCDRSVALAGIRRMMMTTCVRSRFMEDRLAAAAARGVAQLVILGAGLDSTAYRRAEVTRDLVVFEVDYPATQAWKRERLAAIGVALPGNLRFTPYDFERQTLAEALAAGGVRRDLPTFFSWLGVQPYLTDAAVTSTLETIAAFPAGSELVLDLATPTASGGDGGMVEGGARIVASLGEPFRSAYEPEVFAARLRECGFGEVAMVGVDAWLGREGARFNGRFPAPSPLMLVAAQLA